jgi:hypothetical protein
VQGTPNRKGADLRQSIIRLAQGSSSHFELRRDHLG